MPYGRSVKRIDKDYKVPVTFRGYRVLRGDSILAEGNRIDGWLAERGQGKDFRVRTG
jgi:hypothetical protein